MSPFLQVPSLGGGPIPTLTASIPVATAEFTFKYYTHGSSVGTWWWYWSAGTGTYSGTLTLLTGTYNGVSTDSITGEQQTTGNQAWRSGTIDLVSNSISGTGRMVLLYRRSQGGGWAGDVAFQRMSMDINGNVTDLSPPSSTSTVWKGQDSGESGTQANAVSYWQNGSLLSFNTVNTTVYTNGPWAYRTNSVPSNCSYTGPCKEDQDDGSYYMFCETSNNASSNMYNNTRYAFACTTGTFTI